MLIKCTSCGAPNNTSDSSSSFYCSFCGTLIETKSSNVDNFEKNIIKCDIVDNEIKYINRGIESIQELIGLYSDVEIDDISEITLKNNVIKSLKGVSRFTLNSLDLSGNKLSVIDEIPNLKRGEKTFYLKVRNNTELSDISENVIRNISSFKDMWHIHFCFDGCPKFNFDSLGKINFKDILLKDKGKVWSNPIVEIEPPFNIEMPSSLKEQGFIKCISEYDYDGYFVKNIEERNRIVWILEIIDKPIEENLADKTIKKQPNSGCFIATAAMGDYNHPAVIDLRLFRDNWLLQRKSGVKFTNWYYTHGPKIARVIEKSLVLKKLTFIFIVKPLQLLTKKLK